MRRSIEPTVRAPETIFPPDLAERTSVSVNARGVIALGSKMARRHARHGLQDHALVLGELVLVRVVAVDVGAFAQEEEEVA